MLICDSKYRLDNIFPQRAIIFLQQQKYDEAIADLREAIRLWSCDHSPVFDRSITTFHLFIGESQLAKGDYKDAIETLTSALEKPHGQRLWFDRASKDILYSRGYACEKLGDIEAAIKDYTEIFRSSTELPSQSLVRTFAIREGYGKKCGIYGYKISLDELKKIRDDLLVKEESTLQ
jgi:tetratricopeptide (TPR) repeat protein